MDKHDWSGLSILCGMGTMLAIGIVVGVLL